MIILLNIFILLVTAALLITVTTQLRKPINWIVDGVLYVALLLINAAFGGWLTFFALIYALFMPAVIIGIWLYRQQHLPQ
ncbi:hypothetical protein LACPH_001527 [Lacticaseibacillus parahuelsenbergensis]|uniref:Uncharacterized protein n=1 Tax=Lacticaseibacillus parahuelsenbergensis TaxID=3068305 RepID=A0ABY9L6S8_9LACO|nr:hypothetical protein [Lacticaseibacillus sp. NCIMB 15471]WLV79434.1 hypothetical protein LACPH_001527 [Lacticaseibacillus sp. NCIMB 15471]